MSKSYEFPCGCRFPVVGQEEDGRPRIQFDPQLENVPLTCERTWDLISSGNTKGVFQLESRLGQMMAKRLKPRNIEHLAALVAIMRPGCLEALRDGKSVAQHYIDRKNGNEDVELFHPALEGALGPTYGEMCIHKSSYISMADGSEKQICDIAVNDKTQSLIEKSNMVCPSDTCIRVIKSKYEQGLTIRLENGYTITLTKDHKLWTNKGWVEAQYLDSNKHVVATCIKQYSHKQCRQWFLNEFANSIDTAYFIGQLVGDGCSGSAICSGTDEQHTPLLEWLKKHTSLRLKPYKNNKGCNYIGVSHKALANWKDLNIGNRKTKYRLWIESLGLHKTKLEKIIPHCVFITSDKNRRAFLAGLLDSDGYIGQSNSGNTCTIHYCSNNYTIINSIRKLLSIDGIATYITPDYKHIYICNTKKFINLIGQYLVVKTWKHKGNLSTDSNYGTIRCREVKDTILQSHTSLRSYFNHLRPFDRRSLFTSHGFCGQWIGEAVGNNYGDIKWMRIKNIKKTPAQQFYSISIQNNHNVIANGIVVKNCYQEQAMRIAQDVAGFDLQQADILRKAIGKKKPEIMAECKEAFMAGAEAEGIITKEQAEQIFGWIEKSQRYSFNKSHAVSYAINAYLSAYAKAHFPRVFFTSYLYFAKEKQRPREEINELVNNAKLMDIEVYSPDIRHMNKHFKLIDGNIYFGLSDVKGIGDSIIQRLSTHITTCEKEIDKSRDEWNWIDFLVFVSQNVNSTAVKALISSGALEYMQVTRTKMLFDYEVYSRLSSREQEWVKLLMHNAMKHDEDAIPNLLEEILYAMVQCPPGRSGACATKKRLEKVTGFYSLLQNPPHIMEDMPEWIASVEESLLGTPITCTTVDSCDTEAANCTCREFLNKEGGRQGVILLACQVNTVNEIRTKKGKNPGQKMAFLTVSDNSGLLDSVVTFPDMWKEYKSLLTVGNTIMLCGERGKEKDSLIVKKVWQI